jgi:hypothetical protein
MSRSYVIPSGKTLGEVLRVELKSGDSFRLWGSVQNARIRTLKGGDWAEQRQLNGSWLIVQGDGYRRDHILMMRAVLSRESDTGHQVVAGELLDAVALEVEARIESAETETPGTASPWASAMTPARDSEPRAGTSEPRAPMPARPVRVLLSNDEGPVPEAGDLVEHFAFGSCEVIKSDGERLHLRVGKDSRIREIALEMLRVTALPDQGTQRHFKLDRKA